MRYLRPINLLSLVNASNDLSSEVFGLYLNNFGIEIKASELEDLKALVNKIRENSEVIGTLEAFYVGYTINQISKEFDLLRFNKTSIINIELKRKNTGEKIPRQLKQNRYYLSFLDKKVLSFTYVIEDEKLFQLDEGGTLKESDFPSLTSLLNDEEIEHFEDIDKEFDPSNYLVSPFNSTKAFMEDKYFLTDQQENIKKHILQLTTNNGPCFISIEGAAGTGKTLLTYDISKEYLSNSKKVVIFHCGNLNNGHRKLRSNYGWIIERVKEYEPYDLGNYDLVILDETQRIYLEQLNDIITKVKQTNAKCIFSYDAQQCLASWEIKRNIPQHIKAQVSPRIFTLTEKIRTNKEIASFIKNLFNLSNKSPNQKYSNVDVQYFSNVKDYKYYLETLENQDWKVINYTPSKYYYYPYDKYQSDYNDTAHEVIGQEYDNVVAVLDEHFYYNNGRLDTRGYSINPYYHPTKMLFQMVTRARKRLRIIIIQNPNLLHECLKILHNQ
ncbi:hypothetical protein C4A76_18045 [Brevibacillus laterosporus]|uniref:DNA/RNA helicase domain-containing protein n=1 Tax=Brevibacillus laterosporus TaxID=1465 RepID=UPI000CE49268|nr:DNA/RNA helicase domain-containing protein [Brevibacillus laterosporus]PPA84140.1 hypothetical protein C4A76_18045 [Brevibacillus laterosporus]